MVEIVAPPSYLSSVLFFVISCFLPYPPLLSLTCSLPLSTLSNHYIFAGLFFTFCEYFFVMFPYLLNICNLQSDAVCCDQARDFPTCREACEQLTSAKSESRLKHLFHKLPIYCVDSLVNFWECINSTLLGVSRKPQGWVGLGCCELAITSDCRLMCRQVAILIGALYVDSQ
uniref:Reversion-inducing cysteine-rich with Kazal motifs N-terminal domain-containing protein n=1 Tax=Eptatretus burgeri TaxID=7764 RepID=A0A8C4PY39_EPTBU